MRPHCDHTIPANWEPLAWRFRLDPQGVTHRQRRCPAYLLHRSDQCEGRGGATFPHYCVSHSRPVEVNAQGCLRCKAEQRREREAEQARQAEIAAAEAAAAAEPKPEPWKPNRADRAAVERGRQLFAEREARRTERESELAQIVAQATKASAEIVAAADALQADLTEEGVRRLLRAVMVYEMIPVGRVRDLLQAEPFADWLEEGAWFPREAVTDGVVMLAAAAMRTASPAMYGPARRAFGDWLRRTSPD